MLSFSEGSAAPTCRHLFQIWQVCQLCTPQSHCQDRLCELTEASVDIKFCTLACSAVRGTQSVQRHLAHTCMTSRRSRGRRRGAPRFRLCAAWALAAAAAGAAPAAAGLGRACLAGAAVATLPSALITPRGSWPAPAVSFALHSAQATLNHASTCREDTTDALISSSAHS